MSKVTPQDLVKALQKQQYRYLEALMHNWGISPIYISYFGSRAREFHHADSDLDVAVVTSSPLLRYVLAKSLDVRQVAKALKTDTNVTIEGKSYSIAVTFYDINHFAGTVANSDYDFGTMAKNLMEFKTLQPVNDNFYLDYWNECTDPRKIYYSFMSHVKKRGENVYEKDGRSRLMHMVHSFLTAAVLKLGWTPTESQATLEVMANRIYYEKGHSFTPATKALVSYAFNVIKNVGGDLNLGDEYFLGLQNLLMIAHAEVDKQDEKFTTTENDIEKAVVFYDRAAQDLILSATGAL